MSPGADTRPASSAEPVSNPAIDLGTIDPKWAWGRYEPSAATPWGVALAAHLFRRAGFGATWKELQEACGRGPQASIDALLRQPAAYAAFAEEFDGHETAAARSGDGMVFVAWWLRRLRQSPWPLLEKLTLFWHDYFAVRPAPGRRWEADLRTCANAPKTGVRDFPALIGAIANDPAMYAGLGGDQNRKARPNLHFARPWIEVFTLGSEAASDSAVANLARAWTGWFLYGGKLRFIEREHDQESKSLLGREGNWGRDDAVRMLAEDPATAGNVARRLFRAFVSESASPPDSLLAPIAERIARKASLLEVLEMMLRSNLFFSGHAFGQRIKSPVELAIGLVRSLDGGLPSSVVGEELANLGQRLDAPPTVHGWAGGVNWINTISMAARLQLCESLARGSGSFGPGLDAARVAVENGFNTPDSQARFLIDLLLAGLLPDPAVRRITEAAAASPQSMKAVLEMIIAQPEFQLN